MSSLIDPRLVKVRAGSRGSGWVVGTCGVLTARHVVEPFLAGKSADGTPVDWCVAVLDPVPGAPTFDCAVIWQDQSLDLALLRVSDNRRDQWTLAMAGTPVAVLAEPGVNAVAAQAAGYPALALDGVQPAPELVPGSLQPARGAVGGRMVFDVDASVPEDSALWQGLSGAAVRDSQGRLLGVVVAVDKKHQQRRFYVTPLPDPAVDVAFGQALTQVGAPPVLEASAALANRKLLALLNPAGRPYTVAEVPELGNLGIRRSRTDIDTHGDPYFPYVRRDIDHVLRDALDRRLNGTDRRMLLLIGDAMAGKSRTLAEALYRHPALSARPLLVPHRDTDLRQAVELAAANGGVLWLDDVNTYATGLGEVVRALAGTPGVIVTATLRTDQFRRLQDYPDLRLVWDVLSEDRLVEQVTLGSGWAETERTQLDTAEPVIREAVRRGRPLGEALGAADELRKRLSLGSPPEKALVFAVSDWQRTGLPPHLEEDLARRLWLTHLPPSFAADLAEMADEDSEQAFRDALSWACTRIAGVSALLRRTRNGLVAEDYVVGLRTTENLTIPDAIWRQALDNALMSGSEAELRMVGSNAFTSKNYDIAKQALEPVASGGSEFVASTSVLIGHILEEEGDTGGAEAAYRRAIEAVDPDMVPLAAFALGHMLDEQQNLDGAKAAYQVCIDASSDLFAGVVSAAGVAMGTILEDEGDFAGAQAAYQAALDSGDEQVAPVAACALGDLLAGNGDVTGAMAAYQLAIDSAHPEAAATAAHALERLAQERGNASGATAADQRGTGSADSVPGPGVGEEPEVIFRRGLRLADEGRWTEAKAAWQLVISSGHPDWTPGAECCIAEVLISQGDTDGARAAYQRAADSGQNEFGPLAMVKLGTLLVWQRDLSAAQTAYRQAIDSAHPEHAPAAMFLLGRMLATIQQPPDLLEAALLYERAAEAGELGALLTLAPVMAVSGDMGGARDLLRQASRAGSPQASVYAAALDDDPSTRERAIPHLRELAYGVSGDTAALNFLGVLAWLDGDHDLALGLWAGSQYSEDPAAPLLLRFCGQK